jgi:hypothetical protein
MRVEDLGLRHDLTHVLGDRAPSSGQADHAGCTEADRRAEGEAVDRVRASGSAPASAFSSAPSRARALQNPGDDDDLGIRFSSTGLNQPEPPSPVP